MSDSTTETFEHKQLVARIINDLAFELVRRGLRHDDSKLISPEKEAFSGVQSKLKGVSYGSQEYKDSLKELEPAIKHHYMFNSHHPEHYKNGVDGMSLLDLVEMFADWIAATKRMKDGDIRKSIAINKDRFKMSDQLVSILNNTVNREDVILTYCPGLTKEIIAD